MLIKEKGTNYSVSGRICRCVYCGNTVFSIEDDNLDLRDIPSYLSPNRVINVSCEEDKIYPSDKIELFCHSCGVSLGYKLVDRSGLIGDKNYMKINMLEVSPEMSGAA